jgi:NADPH:quinone reductase-like Zn-dependent oxidoreductase
MKALYRETYCGPEGLSVKEVPVPIPGDEDILLQVKAFTINRTDLGVLTGKPYVMRLFCGLLKPHYAVTGTDFAGVVAETGSRVTGIKKGDLIWGFHDNACASHAEFMLVKPGMAYNKLPQGIDLVKIVACAEGAHYARNFIRKVKLSKGMSVFVNGASGAIGSATVQLLRSMHSDLRIVASTRSDNLSATLERGANRVIDYEKENFTLITESFDVVFDSVGKSCFSACKSILKPGGIYISSELGPYWQNLYLPMFTKIRGGRKVKFPFPVNIKQSLNLLQNLFLERKFNPLIDRVISIEEAPENFAYVNSGQKLGNVVVAL